MLSSLRKNIDDCCTFPAVATPPPSLRSLALLIGAMCSLPATAAISDTIHPFVAVTVSHDDNLLRLPNEVAGLQGPRADTITQAQGGLVFERPIGRQVLSGQVKASRVTFGHYDQLNYSGKDLLAALEWHLGNHVEGHLGASYGKTLTPFTDSHSTERNLRVQRREFFDAAWRFHPSWRVRSGFSRDEFEYELETQRFNQRTEKSFEIGIDYLAPSDSRVGLVVRRLKGEYPNKRTFGSFTIDEGYDQNEVKANILWRFSGVTQLQFLGGWVERKHQFFTQRDSKGTNGKVVVNWAPSGKVRFTGTGWREFGAVESALVSNSLNKGASLAADWDVSAKIRANALLRHEKRDFSALPGLALPDDGGDSTRFASVGLSYAPKPTIQLGLNLTHEIRSGSPAIGSGSYTANGVSFNASAQF